MIVVNNSKTEMTVKEKYEQELIKAEHQLINQYSAQGIGAFALTNDTESAIIGKYIENFVKNHIKKIIEIEKENRSDPSASPQLVRYITEIKGEVRKTTEQLLKKEESFRISYHHIRDLIEETFEDGYRLIIFVGAGISNAPKKIEEEAMIILDKHEISYSLPWKKDNWKLIENYRSEFEEKFSDDSVFEGVSITTCQEKIAELFEDKKINQLVIFNWDNLIETAYWDKYDKILDVDSDIIVGNAVPKKFNSAKAYIWHPHGYVGHKNRFVYPHENGFIPEKLIECCGDFSGVFLVIGYRDEENQKLSELLSKKRNKTVKVRLDFTESKELCLLWDGDRFLLILQSWIKEMNKKLA